MMLPPSGSGRPAGALRPPLAQVDDLPQAVVGVRELPFVDQQAGVGLALQHEVLDLIERHDDVFEVGLVEPQRRYAVVSVPGIAIVRPLTPRSRRPVACDDDRAVVVAHAGAVRQQRVLVGEVRVGVKRDRGDLVLAVERGAVQGLDVGEHLVDLDAAGVDGAARQAEEHERVVRVGTMRDGDSCGHLISY